MVSNANNRAAFIKALKSFMTQYGFQGKSYLPTASWSPY